MQRTSSEKGIQRKRPQPAPRHAERPGRPKRIGGGRAIQTDQEKKKGKKRWVENQERRRRERERVSWWFREKRVWAAGLCEGSVSWAGGVGAKACRQNLALCRYVRLRYVKSLEPCRQVSRKQVFFARDTQSFFVRAETPLRVSFALPPIRPDRCKQWPRCMHTEAIVLFQ